MLKSNLLILIFLVGCATKPDPLPVIKIEKQEVKVPVNVPCKVTIPDVPKFSFNELSVEQDIYEKTRSLLSDRLLHLGYETELLAALKSCMK